MSLRRLAVVAALAMAAAVPAAAATYTFDVRVTESVDTPSLGFVLPGVGTIGTISFTLDAAALDGDGDPMTGVGIDMPLDPALAGASASIGGLASMLSDPTVFGFPNRARFSNGDFSSIAVTLPSGNCASLGCTFAGNFSVFGPAGSPAPTTFADVEAFLTNPLSTVAFSFNGTAVGQFASFRAESFTAAPVPLPATGMLLVGALAGLGVWRRRKGDA
ncbi:VPLPA-CTERM sorting domain-containing protein [Paracoccus sp. TK19116]|uniref:VPLPA-CTERM sorting domain-containing protein n=1 Tax=Paracoccus albicereus TaxID=2922394 RepID=A0ABT1MRE0_9RHOB|nr:VPLPA-CTERM sorting domain-containing protein [Paracoccus albicereus]MCQ0970862.1 VPLPA-CTERM sorting domain-containing protein [Paracoccus albicereus]